MPLDEVTAETLAGSKGELEVHPASGMQAPEIRAVERFLQNIEAEFVAVLTRDGETATIHRHAVADLNLFGQPRSDEINYRSARADDDPDFLNKAGEHF